MITDLRHDEHTERNKKAKVMSCEEDFFDIEKIRTLVSRGNIVWRDHAMRRLRERKITRDDVRSAIYNGEIVEERPEGYPTPSCLILGSNISGRYLHVVCGLMDEFVYIISAYYPDPERWEFDFTTRKG